MSTPLGITRSCALLLLALGLALPACTDIKRMAYEDFGDRDEWQEPDRVVESLALAPGARVGDLGAGGGYFTFRLAEAVGPDGKVYAIDVDEGMLEYLREKATEDGHANVETVLAAGADPKLPEPVDLVFTCNTFHHLEDRAAYFGSLKRHLRPGGRVAIIDYSGEGGFFERRHSTPPDDIRSEMEQAGYRLEKDAGDFLERQSFLIFSPEAEGG
jgi:ubiquinone/menaquinone biosynthesis C-methylase UbiE